MRRSHGESWKNHIIKQGEDELANVALLDDPLTLRDAMACDDAHKWEDAMHDKYESIIANGTWKETTLSTNRIPIGCKWVFR